MPQGSSIEVGPVNCRRHDLHSLWAQAPPTHERKERKKRKKETKKERKEWLRREGEGGRGGREGTVMMMMVHVDAPVGPRQKFSG